MQVISARKGEFETGFEGGGQTREHVTLCKTLGVKKLICVINKMDEPSVLWSEPRYQEIISKLNPFFRSVGYSKSGRTLSLSVHLPFPSPSHPKKRHHFHPCQWILWIQHHGFCEQGRLPLARVSPSCCILMIEIGLVVSVTQQKIVDRL